MNAKELESYKASRGIRKALIDVAIEYQNNYLTPERYAERNGLTVTQAKVLLTLAKDIQLTNHPDL